MATLKEQGTKAFIWDFFGKMATHGMGFIVSIFLARLLEPSDFGLIAMIMVIIGMASIFTDVGLGGALIQRRRLHSIHYSSVFYFNVFVGLLLTIMTYLSASLISKFYDNEQLTLLAEVMSFSFVINAFSSVQRVRLRKELNYTLLTKIGLLSSLISGVIGISLAYWGAGVWSLVTQTLTAGIIYNILIWTSDQWKPALEFSWKALTQLWGFGFHIFLAGILDEISTRLDILIIGKIYNPSTLGFFQRAKSLNSMVVQYSSGSLMAVLFPLLSKIQYDLLQFRHIVLSSLGIIVFIIFLILGNLYLVSEELIVFLFSDKWLSSVVYFKILILSGFGYPVSVLLVNVLMSRGKSKDFLRLTIYKQTIFFTNLYIGFLFGIEEYLYGLVIVSTTGVLLNALFASREMKISLFLLLKPIIIQMLLTIFVVIFVDALVREMEFSVIILLIIKGIVFTLFYFIFNYIMKVNSFNYFLIQIIPLIRNQINKVRK